MPQSTHIIGLSAVREPCATPEIAARRSITSPTVSPLASGVRCRDRWIAVRLYCPVGQRPPHDASALLRGASWHTPDLLYESRLMLHRQRRTHPGSPRPTAATEDQAGSWALVCAPRVRAEAWRWGSPRCIRRLHGCRANGIRSYCAASTRRTTRPAFRDDPPGHQLGSPDVVETLRHHQTPHRGFPRPTAAIVARADSLVSVCAPHARAVVTRSGSLRCIQRQLGDRASASRSCGAPTIERPFQQQSDHGHLAILGQRNRRQEAETIDIR